MSAFALHVVTMTCIYALVVLGLQLAVGRGKVLFIAPTLAFAIGAYASALLTTTGRASVPAGIAIGALLAFVASGALGLLSWRLRGDHLILATLGLCEIVRSCLNNWDDVTGGSIGVMNVPPLWPKVTPGKYPLVYLGVSATALALGIIVCRRLNRAPFGRVHAALAGDEAGTAAIGRPVGRTKLLAIAWGGVLGSLGGALLAHYAGYIDPSSFTVGEAVMLFAMLIIGGLGNPLGAVVGTAIFVLLPEGLRFLGLPGQMADPLRRAVCGVMVLLFVRFRPQGLFGSVGLTERPGRS